MLLAVKNQGLKTKVIINNNTNNKIIISYLVHAEVFKLVTCTLLVQYSSWSFEKNVSKCKTTCSGRKKTFQWL